MPIAGFVVPGRATAGSARPLQALCRRRPASETACAAVPARRGQFGRDGGPSAYDEGALEGEERDFGPDVSAREILTLLRSNERDLALRAYRSAQPKAKFSDVELASLVAEFGRRSSPQAAQTVLREFEDATQNQAHLRAYNALVSSFCANGDGTQAEALVQEMSGEDGCGADSVSYSILVNFYVRRAQMPAAESVVRTMESVGVPPDTYLFTSLVRGYAHNRNYREVARCFKRLEAAELEPDRVLYNTAISAARRARSIKAAEYYYRRDGIPPDVYTITPLIQLYTEAGDYERAEKAFQLIRRQQLDPDLHAYSALMVAYNRSSNLVGADDLLTEMEALGVTPDTVIFNTVLSLRARMGRDTGNLLRRMDEIGVKRDAATASILANATARSREPSEAIAAAEQNPDSVTNLAPAIRASSAEGDVDKALDFFRRARSLGANTAVYNAAVQALIVARRHEAAYAVLDEMRAQDIAFDVATYCLMMVLLGRTHEASRGAPFKILEEMTAAGVVPDAAVFNAMLKVRSVTPDVVLQEMKRRGVKPDEHTRRALITAFVRRKQLSRAVKMLDRLSSWDKHVVNLVTRSLRRSKQVEVADRIQNDAERRGLFPDSGPTR